MDSRLATLLVTGIVVLSGCSALGIDGLSRQDGDHAGATPTLAGMEDGELTDADELVESHREALRGTTYRARLTVTNASGTYYAATVLNGTDGNLATVDAPWTSIHGAYYWSPDVKGKYNWSSGEIRYGYGNATSVGYAAGSMILRQQRKGPAYLDSADWSRNGTETVDGERRFIFTADALTVDRPIGPAGGPDGSVQSADGRMVVTGDGVVRRLVIEQRIETPDGALETVTIEYALDRRGDVTASPPSWLDEPIQLEASLVADGKLLALEHTGGAPIPEGPNLLVDFDTNVTTHQRMSEGDTVYVYRRNDAMGANYRVAEDGYPPDLDDIPPFTDSVNVMVTQGNYTSEASVEIEDEH